VRRDPALSPLLEPAIPGPPPAGWRVHAPGRLHLGFLDPAGSLGRRFGSLGLVVEGFETVVDLRLARCDEATASAADDQADLPRALDHLEALRQATGRREALKLHLEQLLPVHAGFGSGTQLALAIGHAFCRVLDLRYSSGELARITGRGLRSGVGISGFDQGGLLLDGGPRSDGAPAALLSRLTLPPHWRVLLALDPRVQGLTGASEKRALAELAPLPRESAARICHDVLMRILPGAAAGEFEPFAAGITGIQAILGAHFAPAQGGRAFASAAVQQAIEWIGAHTRSGVGQSSWGPTGFAFFPSSAAAEAALARARAVDAVDPALSIHIVRARDHGATLAPLPPAP
jgi:beta-RFAP synthase